MKVKIIDCEHELDLEEEVNFFFENIRIKSNCRFTISYFFYIG